MLTAAFTAPRRPDPDTGVPVPERVPRYAYDLRGEVRAVFEGDRHGGGGSEDYGCVPPILRGFARQPSSYRSFQPIS